MGKMSKYIYAKLYIWVMHKNLLSPNIGNTFKHSVISPIHKQHIFYTRPCHGDMMDVDLWMELWWVN